MEAHELFPPRAEIQVDDVVLELKPFSLFEKSWAHREFATKEQGNGITNLAESLQKLEMLVVAKFAWRLVADKSLISEEAFFKYCSNSRNLVKVYNSILTCLRDSEPPPAVGKRLQEIKKF